MAVINFDKETHTYTNDKGVVLISCTQLLSKMGLTPNYSGVSEGVLEKASGKGALIHEEINSYLLKDEIGFTRELQDFIKFKESRTDIRAYDSEIIVSNEKVAGTVDLIYYTDDPIDNAYTQAHICEIKTTSVIHWDSISWQLSIYNYLAFKFNYENTVGHLFYFANGEMKIYDIPLKPKKEVEKLLKAYTNNEKYIQTNYIPQALTNELEVAENQIILLNNLLEEQQKKSYEIKNKIITIMEENGVKSFDTPKLKITLISGQKRETLDAKKLKDQLPSIYKSFVKETIVKPTLRITIKGEKENE